MWVARLPLWAGGILIRAVKVIALVPVVADPLREVPTHVVCPIAFLRGDPEYRDYFLAKRDQGIALEFYSATGWASDPYSGRLHAWSCWRFDADGFYTWSLTDTGGASSWNEYLTLKDSYSPIFLDETSVTAGKHLEAAREGVQDYEYFAMLDRAIQEASAAGVTGPEVEEARRLLATLPLSVLKAGGHETMDSGPLGRHHWLNEKIDRTLADKGRIQVLAALTALAERSGLAATCPTRTVGQGRARYRSDATCPPAPVGPALTTSAGSR